MKQFLLVGIAVLFVGANASENPFDLKENFGKIDSDQEVLLSELRKLAESKALAQEKEAEVETPKAVEAPAIPVPPMVEETIPQPEDAVIEEVDYSRFEKIRQKVIESEKEKSEVQETVKLETEKQESADEKVKIQELEDSRIEEENKVLAASIKEKEVEIEKVKAQREAEKLEVEAYEKERAEKLANRAEAKIADEIKNKKLPKELSFFQKLIEVKATGKYKPLEGELKKILESIIKEKNNPNYTVDDIKNEFDSLKDNKEIGMMFMAYIIAKSVVLQESMDSDEIKEFDTKFQKDSFDKNNMEKILEKYPNELRELGFNLLEDVLANGIPQMDLDMSFNMTASSDGEVQIDIENKEVNQEEKSKIVDINITREESEAKDAADIAYEEAVKEMDLED